MQRLVITRPDDWHIHLRSGASLERTVADASRYFGRVIVMPNLVPPCANTADADVYRQQILAHVPTGNRFQP
ncbi:MAG TPA: dihydroorotase, partial [Pseudomonadales bacterium]|nr:dihydroorotase [Pseudomonadales bacterium]